MATETMEAKLSQKITGIFHEQLFQVFTDVRKSYDYLYIGICMEILRGMALGLI